MYSPAFDCTARDLPRSAQEHKEETADDADRKDVNLAKSKQWFENAWYAPGGGGLVTVLS